MNSPQDVLDFPLIKIFALNQEVVAQFE
jgi:hypothetical protein